MARWVFYCDPHILRIVLAPCIPYFSWVHSIPEMLSESVKTRVIVSIAGPLWPDSVGRPASLRNNGIGVSDSGGAGASDSSWFHTLCLYGFKVSIYCAESHWKWRVWMYGTKLTHQAGNSHCRFSGLLTQIKLIMRNNYILDGGPPSHSPGHWKIMGRLIYFSHLQACYYFLLTQKLHKSHHFGSGNGRHRLDAEKKLNRNRKAIWHRWQYCHKNITSYEGDFSEFNNSMFSS